jgi:hypothetical protein
MKKPEFRNLSIMGILSEIISSINVPFMKIKQLWIFKVCMVPRSLLLVAAL